MSIMLPRGPKMSFSHYFHYKLNNGHVFCIQTSYLKLDYLSLDDASRIILFEHLQDDWWPFSEKQKMLGNSVNMTLTGLFCHDIK